MNPKIKEKIEFYNKIYYILTSLGETNLFI